VRHKRVLAEYRASAQPLASLRDAEAMMQVMDANRVREGGSRKTPALVILKKQALTVETASA